MFARTAALVAGIVVAFTFAAYAPVATARAEAAPVEIATLPREASDVLANIRRGPPFPYERDGIAFGNREKLLPAQPRGYYREYTVRTPGAKNRGARRIVCGGPARSPDACWYSDDHYASFRRILE